MKLRWLAMGAAVASLTTVAQAQNTVEVSMDGTPVYFSGPGPMLVGGEPMVRGADFERDVTRLLAALRAAHVDGRGA